MERIRLNAHKFNQSVENELNRVIIHGILHLVGYNDKKEDEIKIMREKEEYYLGIINTNV
jgi:rRNA maturation RNase YbeY